MFFYRKKFGFGFRVFEEIQCLSVSFLSVSVSLCFFFFKIIILTSNYRSNVHITQESD